MTPADLKAYAVVMQEMGIRRVQAETDDESEEFTIEMDDTAFAARLAAATPGDSAQALEAAAESEKCACGHDRVSEHNGGLCIAGACDPALCNPTKPVTP